MTTPMCNGTTHTWSDDSYSRGSFPCPGPERCPTARARLEPPPAQAAARQGDPETSHAAAASVGGGDLTENQRAVMTVMRQITGAAPLDEDIVQAYEMVRKAYGLPRQSDSGIRSRRAELAKAGQLKEEGKRRMSTGRMGRTWSINEGGTT